VRVPSQLAIFRPMIEKLRELPSEVSATGWKQRWREIDALMARCH
jgi:hypothetical protein